jgi:hypothetical protein
MQPTRRTHVNKAIDFGSKAIQEEKRKSPSCYNVAHVWPDSYRLQRALCVTHRLLTNLISIISTNECIRFNKGIAIAYI